MDINNQINKAYQAIEDYQKLSSEERQDLVISTKFSISKKNPAFFEFVRKWLSFLCLGHYQLAQTKWSALERRINKLSSEASPEEKLQLKEIHDKLKQLFLENVSQDPEAGGNQVKVENLVARIEEKNKQKQISEMNNLDYILLFAKVHQLLAPDVDMFQKMGLTDKNLLRPYEERFNDDTSGYDKGNFNALLACYFDREDSVGIGEDLGKNREGTLVVGDEGYAYGKGLKGNSSMAYFPVIRTAQAPSSAYEIVKRHLHNLKTCGLTPEQMPKKLFIPLFCSNETLGHVMLIIVEPTGPDAARITAVNTSTGLCGFDPYEQEALRAAHDVFPHPKTTIVSNKKQIFSTAKSCGVDVIALIKKFMNVDNIQNEVSKGLTPIKYQKERLQQAKDLNRFYQKNWKP